MPKIGLRHLSAGCALALGLAVAMPAQAQDSLTVWFTKGFYKGEDAALTDLIDRYQKATGVKVELSLYSTEDCIVKSVAAVEAGTPPDVGYCTTYDFRTTGQWAYEGRLEDVSDVLTPIKDSFQPDALATTFLMNGKTGRRPITPSRSNARPCTSSTGRTCCRLPASPRPTSRPSGTRIGTSGATRCRPACAPRASASTPSAIR